MAESRGRVVAPTWQFKMLRILCELSGLDYDTEVYLEAQQRKKELAKIRRDARTPEEKAKDNAKQIAIRLKRKETLPKEILEERRKRSIEKSRNWYQNNKKEQSEKSKKRYYENHEAILAKDKKDSETLSDRYVKRICRSHKIEPTDDIIKLKRAAIALKRACKVAGVTTLPVVKQPYDDKKRAADYIYRAQNKEALRIAGKRWREANKEVLKLKKAEYVLKLDKAKVAEYHREYQKAHKEELREKARLWRLANPDKVLATRERFKKNHPEQVRVYKKRTEAQLEAQRIRDRERYAANPEKYKALQKARNEKKKAQI